LVKIYIDEILNFEIVHYTIYELFRYIDTDFCIIKEYEKADIIYGSIDCGFFKNKIQIIANEIFWKNYKKLESLPLTPLPKKNGTTYIYAEDIIASTFFMLSGYEEYLNLKRDGFDRFLYQYSYYKKDEIYTKPIVEKYREILINQLNDIGIKCKRKNIWNNSEFGLFLSHDVDGVYKYRNTLKSIAKILLKPSKFTFKEFIKSKKDINNDPYFKGFDYLINQSNKYNFKSTFFLITKYRERLDNFYNYNDKNIKNIIKKIHFNNFEIGLHGSLKSSKISKYMKEEGAQLEFKTYGIRQHYLMYDINKTSQIQDEIFTYDSTLCFPDMIGFRRGTCLPFKLFNIKENTTLNIYEIPLLAMDTTLSGYMKLSTNEAYNKILELLNDVNKYNGLFTFLWHPGNCSDEWNIWLKEVYEKTLSYLSNKSVESICGKDISLKFKG
jgi:hypothetical protein